ncbi:hypothetical protein ACJ73_01106 [Blastomyces percursus]|uniref:Mediator of RNA polymerase II transcription subunit 9 n=1 Tax=Blastomyces percursus TaxID=1658174 RepID=A0A1J9RIQ5_9EURO|nr:hypothetical protein ACJ73_01106 [Blastomyces percursus]
MTSSRTPTSASLPGQKASSFQLATGTSSPATPSFSQQFQSQTQPQLQPEPQDTAQPAPFPPPQTFDILPALYDLLFRLASSSSNPHQHSADPTSTGGNDGPSSAIGGPGPAHGAPSANTAAERPNTINAAAVAFLDPKLLLSEASAVKIRIQKAKAALEALPDMQRDVAEQEDEIKALEAKIERLKGIIVEFGRRSRVVTGLTGTG